MVEQCYHQNVLYVAVKGQKAKGILSSLVLNTPLSKIPLFGDISLKIYCLKLIKCNDLIVVTSIK